MLVGDADAPPPLPGVPGLATFIPPPVLLGGLTTPAPLAAAGVTGRGPMGRACAGATGIAAGLGPAPGIPLGGFGTAEPCGEAAGVVDVVVGFTGVAAPG